MTLLRLYPMMSFVVVLLAIVAQCVSQRNPWLLLVAGGLAALSRSVSEGPRGLTLPRPFSLLLTAIALMWCATVAAADLSQPIPAIGQFVAWLTVIKLYESHTLENEAERLILSLLLMVLASLVSIDLLFGLLLLIWSALGLVTLMLFQLYCAADRMQTQRARALAVAQLGSPTPVSGPGLRRHYRNVSIAAVLLIFVLSTVGFLLFPRNLTTSLSQAGLSNLGRGEVALDEGVDLLGNTRISLSGVQVLSVGLSDAAGEVVQLDRPIRLRASVLTAYRGDGIWGVSAFAPVSMELQANQWRTFYTIEDDQDTIWQDFTIDEPADQLLSVSVPAGIEVGNDMTLAFRNSSQTMRAARESVPPMKYRVRAVTEPPLYRPAMEDRHAPGMGMLHPYANSRVRERALALLKEANVPATPPTDSATRLRWNLRVADVFERHLKYGSFQYTLDLTSVGVSSETADMDPIERFLLQEPYGHCEYFASALLGLCHSVHVPGRLVTGYVSNRFDDLSQRYIVVRSDAHAWVEVLGEGPRWAVFDPTPPANVPGTREASMGPIDRVVWLWRWLEGQWRFNVLGFDFETQIYLSDALLPEVSSHLSEGVRATGSWLRRLRGTSLAGRWPSLILVFVMASGLLTLVIRIRNRLRRARVLQTVDLSDLTGTQARVWSQRLGFYVDTLDALALGGHPKPMWQPPAAFAAGLEDPELASAVSEIAQTYYRIRFGTPDQAGVRSTQPLEITHTMANALRRVRVALGLKT